MEKANTHIVIKKEDALKYLTEFEYQNLEQMLCTISKGRSEDGKRPFNSYYICNTDEPYAEVIHGVIIGGEAVKGYKPYREMDNAEIRHISYEECPIKCTGCEALCNEMPVGQCRKNLSQAFDNK